MSTPKQPQRGFTLVEIMVSLMIFSLVVVVALAALVKIIDANKKAQTIQDAVVNLSFTMESMTRELRTGSSLNCQILGANSDLSVTSLSGQNVSACSNVTSSGDHGVGFAFLSSRSISACPATSNRLITAYEIVPNQSSGGGFDGTFSFKKALQTECGGSLSFSHVVATSSVSISSYYVQMNDAQYPLAFVRLDGIAGTKESAKTYFGIQTAASPRLP